MRGRNHPDVDRDLLLGAQRAHLVVFQDAQQLRLEPGGHLAHFVEEERPSLRGPNQSLPIGVRAREAPRT